MEGVQLLEKLTAKTAPGRTPLINPAYALKILRMIRYGPIGRKNISDNLDLGEGVIRTIVKRLIEEGLVSTTRQGMMLTTRGERMLNDIGRNMIGVEFPQTILTVSPANYAVLVKNGVSSITTGLAQRDDALLAGARGATTLVFQSNRLIMPGTEIIIDEDLRSMIMNLLSPLEGDVIIVGSDDKLLNAEIGAYTAGLKLLLSLIN